MRRRLHKRERHRIRLLLSSARCLVTIYLLLAGILLLIRSVFCQSDPIRSDPVRSRFCQRTSLRDEFTLLSASWLIRARWGEIQRFVRKFKKMKSIHDMQFWVFCFRKQKIGPQRCSRMAVVEIILLKRVSAIHFL